jgi:hypothetical protein
MLSPAPPDAAGIRTARRRTHNARSDVILRVPIGSYVLALGTSQQGQRWEPIGKVMKRRLAVRDRLAWLIAIAAAAVGLYIVLPMWMLVAAVLVAIAVPLLVRRNRQRSHR